MSGNKINIFNMKNRSMQETKEFEKLPIKLLLKSTTKPNRIYVIFHTLNS